MPEPKRAFARVWQAVTAIKKPAIAGYFALQAALAGCGGASFARLRMLAARCRCPAPAGQARRRLHWRQGRFPHKVCMTDLRPCRQEPVPVLRCAGQIARKAISAYLASAKSYKKRSKCMPSALRQTRGVHIRGGTRFSRVRAWPCSLRLWVFDRFCQRFGRAVCGHDLQRMVKNLQIFQRLHLHHLAPAQGHPLHHGVVVA